MDTSVPTSGAAWQLHSTEHVLKQQMERSLSLPLVPRVVTTPDVLAIPSIPKNTPVSQVSHAPSLAMPLSPSVPDQHNVQSHPHTGPGDMYYYSGTSGGPSLNDVLNDVFPNFVHCEPSYERSFELTKKISCLLRVVPSSTKPGFLKVIR